jgi:sulfite exporter TauE/SafE
MTELPLIALGGLLGSSHCVGMCGGFAVSIGLGAPSPARNLARQIAFSGGRVFTYGFLGAVAGFAGFWFARRSGTLVHAQALLSLTAGMFLIVEGSRALGLVPRGVMKRWPGGGPGASCLAGSFVGPFLASPRGYHVFVAGLLNGLLPCGLVYGYLALASSTASLPAGFATMAAFGAGTVPLMVLTGVGASIVPYAARRRLFRLAGLCVLLTGLLAASRGVQFWTAGDAVRCPACRSDIDPTSPPLKAVDGGRSTERR